MTMKVKFTKMVIGTLMNNVDGGEFNCLSAAGDINGDGKIDYVTCGRNGMLVWFENSGDGEHFASHVINTDFGMECGGSLVDITGTGTLDLINGNGPGDEIYWWENPGMLQKNWARRTIFKSGSDMYHDTIIGEIKNDGRKYLVFTNQCHEGGTWLVCVPIPENPRVSPWPDIEVVATELHGINPFNPGLKNQRQPEEGLAIGDIDGDGELELICGTCWYKWINGAWQKSRFAEQKYITVKCLVADIDGDGKNEILLSEGDPCIYGRTEGGLLSYFKPGADIRALWEEHVIDRNLRDAHSLHAGDILGNGKVDLFVAEIGVAVNHVYQGQLPRLFVYENDGIGNFTRHVIDEGTGTHEAVLVDLRGQGVLDIIGKPLHGDEMWNIHVWRNDSRQMA